MRCISIIIIVSGLFLFSFSIEQDIGKGLFEDRCRSCHLPNKSTSVAPSFQNIRRDYGLEWTLAFVKESIVLKRKGDIRMLYSYYLFGRKDHIMYPALEPEFIVAVLDYVDSFPVDSLQYKHRLVSEEKKRQFVNQESAKYKPKN